MYHGLTHDGIAVYIKITCYGDDRPPIIQFRNGQPANSRTISTRKMKKRLRKKKHQGEFREWGRQLVITRNTKDGFNDFLDAFKPFGFAQDELREESDHFN